MKPDQAKPDKAKSEAATPAKPKADPATSLAQPSLFVEAKAAAPSSRTSGNRTQKLSTVTSVKRPKPK